MFYLDVFNGHLDGDGDGIFFGGVILGADRDGGRPRSDSGYLAVFVHLDNIFIVGFIHDLFDGGIFGLYNDMNVGFLVRMQCDTAAVAVDFDTFNRFFEIPLQGNILFGHEEFVVRNGCIFRFPTDKNIAVHNGKILNADNLSCPVCYGCRQHRSTVGDCITGCINV